MGNNKEEFTAQSAIMVFWIVAILFVTFAPKEIRKELVDYGIKFIGIIVLLIGAYMLYLITIKDKIVARRRRKEQEEIEQFQRSARERAQKWKEEQEKNKRED